MGFIAVGFLAVVFLTGCNEKSPTFPRQVLLMRHAEKPTDVTDTVLSEVGKKRAEALAGLFNKSEARPEPLPKPDFIFAAQASQKSNRSVETVTPLAKSMKLEIDSGYANADYGKLAAELLSNPKYEGKTVLICWHHGKLSEFAEQLGVESGKWADDVFDRVWVITYEKGKGTLTKRPQRLLPGDREK